MAGRPQAMRESVDFEAFPAVAVSSALAAGIVADLSAGHLHELDPWATLAVALWLGAVGQPASAAMSTVEVARAS